MDRSTLKYDGPTVSVAADDSGFTVTRGGKAGPKVVCDGKPNAPDNGVITTCSKSGSGYEVENTRDGKQINKIKIELSPDGKKLSRTIDITPPDGSPYTLTTTSKRLSGGPGFSGVWKETSFTESQDNGVLTIEVKGDSVDFKETRSRLPVSSTALQRPHRLAGQ
ncbi:hypothetical protein [Occallatibacter savannae]|uniref:hypothetical protein n=1 Tax=Occallatibacter savannae TaxID=1002691 RepID=UPI0013A58D39|nr:hypothetical protein [Occallatibacter savannae]